MNGCQRSAHEQSAAFLIRLYIGERGQWSGDITHVTSGQLKEFEGVPELLLLIHGKMDEMQYPKADWRLRSWNETKEPPGALTQL